MCRRKERMTSVIRSGFVGSAVIHSVNEVGAMRMKARLQQAQIAPFGTFEVSLV
jgi:hypothetical protein